MREILFRGKRVDNGTWAYGDLLHCDDEMEIDSESLGENGGYIIPETVGQYTGLTDKNGTRIFEGDICWFYGGEYYSGSWEHNAIVAITDITDDEQIHYLKNAEYCEIIGNVFDNPELLDEEQK